MVATKRRENIRVLSLRQDKIYNHETGRLILSSVEVLVLNIVEVLVLNIVEVLVLRVVEVLVL